MQAGKLRHRVTLQRYVLGSPSQTLTGAPDGGWEDYLTVSASIEPISGREPFLAQAHLSEITHKVRMRYRDGITSAMRVSWNGRLFDIKYSMNWEERNRELQLLCVEGVSEG